MPSKPDQLSNTLQLWFSSIGSDTAELSTDKLLSATESERLSLIKGPYKRQEYLLSRILMRHALSQNFLCPEKEWFFTERPDSSPEISNLPANTYYSLSHSKGLICFAIANSPVGIDIELADANRDFLSLAKIFMSDEELQNMNKNTQMQADIFYRTWCVKEAYYKAISSFEQNDISYKDIPSQALFKNETDWSLTEGNIGKFHLSAVMKNQPKNIICHYFPKENNTYHFDIKP